MQFCKVIWNILSPIKFIREVPRLLSLIKLKVMFYYLNYQPKRTSNMVMNHDLYKGREKARCRLWHFLWMLQDFMITSFADHIVLLALSLLAKQKITQAHDNKSSLFFVFYNNPKQNLTNLFSFNSLSGNTWWKGKPTNEFVPSNALNIQKYINKEERDTYQSKRYIDSRMNSEYVPAASL